MIWCISVMETWNVPKIISSSDVNYILLLLLVRLPGVFNPYISLNGWLVFLVTHFPQSILLTHKMQFNTKLLYWNSMKHHLQSAFYWHTTYNWTQFLRLKWYETTPSVSNSLAHNWYLFTLSMKHFIDTQNANQYIHNYLHSNGMKQHLQSAIH